MYSIERDRLFTSSEDMDFSREYYLCNSLGSLEAMLCTDSRLRCELVEENDGSGDADCPFWGTRSERHYRYAYDVPDELRETDIMTNIELAEWLARGNGLIKWEGVSESYTYLILNDSNWNDQADESILIRAWDEKEWHRPWKER